MPSARVIPIDGEDRRRAAATEQESAEELFDMVEAANEQGSSLSERMVGAMSFLRRRLTGDYDVDDFGFDPDLLDNVLMAPMRPLYEKYFRVETRGLENVPDTGPALIVANHSGTVALDSAAFNVVEIMQRSVGLDLRYIGETADSTLYMLTKHVPFKRK